VRPARYDRSLVLKESDHIRYWVTSHAPVLADGVSNLLDLVGDQRRAVWQAVVPLAIARLLKEMGDVS
jgi:hypothetical protein